MRHAAVFGTVMCGVALAGCGGAGTKTFSHPGFAIHFTYPGQLRSARTVHLAIQSGQRSGTTDVAIGIASHDAILVTLYPDIRPPIAAKNISTAKPELDGLLSRAFGHVVLSTLTTVGGLPALSYPPVPVPNRPGAMNRVTLVFVDHQEYELNCQYTVQGRATITNACEQMLATLHT